MALLALAAIIALSWNTVQTQIKQILLPAPELMDITIEHTEPLSLRFEYTAKAGTALLQITHKNGNETIVLNLPEEWQRREVRGAKLADVPPDTSSFGITRWTLPPGAGFQFWLPRTPKNLIVHNPGGSPLKIVLLRYSLETDTLEEDVILIQSDATTLW